MKLTFGSEEGSIDILEMVSGEDEHVGLGKNLKARGNVEDWMTLVELRMKSELTLALKEGLVDYDTKVNQSYQSISPAFFLEGGSLYLHALSLNPL